MKIYLYDVSAGIIEEMENQVSIERQNKSKRCKNEMDRKRSLGVEVLINRALKDLAGCALTPVKLETDEYSKPHIVFDEKSKQILSDKGIVGFNGETIEFSVSHAGKYVALIIADDVFTEVGIDVEKQRDSANGIAARFFMQEECANITSARRMFIYWTLKESFLKAIGRGLSYPMNAFKVVLEGDLDDKKAHGALYEQKEFTGEYYGKTFFISPDYYLSICTHNYDCRDILDNSIIIV